MVTATTVAVRGPQLSKPIPREKWPAFIRTGSGNIY